MPSKKCGLCKIEKSFEEFYNSRQTKDGKYGWCIDCKKEQRPKYVSKEFKIKRVMQNRNYHLMKKYGLTHDDILKKLKTQGNVCKVCKSPDPKGVGWVVDHNHNCCPGKYTCGKCIRAILCDPCNKLLGAARDDMSILSSCIEYLMEEGENFAK